MVISDRSKDLIKIRRRVDFLGWAGKYCHRTILKLTWWQLLPRPIQNGMKDLFSLLKDRSQSGVWSWTLRLLHGQKCKMANSWSRGFIDNIPVGGTGKVWKKDLRATYGSILLAVEWNNISHSFITLSRNGRWQNKYLQVRFDKHWKWKNITNYRTVNAYKQWWQTGGLQDHLPFRCWCSQLLLGLPT